MSGKVLLLLFTIFSISNSAEASLKVYKGMAVLVVRPEKVEAFKAAVNKIIAPTRKEPANISYEAYQVVDENGIETNRFEFHELWKSKDAMMIDHKENSPHMKEFFKTIKANTPETYLESFQVDGRMVNVIQGLK